MWILIAYSVAISLDDEVVEILGMRWGEGIGLTVNSKDLLTTSFRLSHRANTLTERFDEERHERRHTILHIGTPHFIVRMEGMNIAWLSIDIEAIVAVLIDEVADAISILDDSSTASSLTFFRLLSAPAPILMCPLFATLKSSLFCIRRIWGDTSAHIEDEEADHRLQALLLLCITQVLELSFCWILPPAPERDEVYRVGQAHQ